MNTPNKKVIIIIGLLMLFGQQTVVADPRRGHDQRQEHGQRHAPVKRWRTVPAPRKHRIEHRHDRSYIAPHQTYRHYYKPGYRVRPLPYGASRIYHNKSEYYFYDGYFYRPSRSGYVVVESPIGAIIASLPPLHHIFHWHGQPFFVIGDTFYRRHPRGYIVVPDPRYSYPRW